jgi:hypothetical protein
VKHLGRCLIAACLLASWPARAFASDVSVALELHDCDALSENALREHLELELATLGLSQSTARLVLRCEPSSVAIELFEITGARYAVAVRVELGDTARLARERLVALAATELLAQAERAHAAQPVRAGRPAPPPPRAPAPSDAAPQPGEVSSVKTRPRPRIELFVAAQVALDGVPRTALWGGSLGTRWGLTRSWSVLVDTRFERGESNVSLADVRWTALSGFAGAAANTQAGAVGLAAGLGVRAGWLALDARARAPLGSEGFTAPWAGVAAPLRVALEAGGVVLPFVGAEVGYVLAPVRGRVRYGEVLVEQRGLWFSGSLGVAVVL